MLHLNTGVHLHEIEVPVRVEEKFDGACGVISYGPCYCHGDIAHCLSQLIIQGRRGGFLEQLLMLTLNGALSFTQVDDIPVHIAKYLEFNMFGILDIFLYKDAGVVECFLSLAAGHIEHLLHLRLLADDAHSPAAATGGRLDNYRVTYAGCMFQCLILIGDTTRSTHGHGYLVPQGYLPGDGFIAHLVYCVG